MTAVKKSMRGQWLHLHLFHLPFFSILPSKGSFQRNIRLIVQIFVLSSNLPIYHSCSEEIHPVPPGKRKLPTFPLGFPLFNNLYRVQSTRPTTFEGVICGGKSGQFRCRESHTHSSCFLAQCLSHGAFRPNVRRIVYIRSHWKDVNSREFEGICVSWKYWSQARSYAWRCGVKACQFARSRWGHDVNMLMFICSWNAMEERIIIPNHGRLQTPSAVR